MTRYLFNLFLCLFFITTASNAQYISLKPGFGSNNGFSFTNLQAVAGATISQRAYSVLTLPDGKMIVACESASASILLKLNDDGSPDLSFGAAGKVVVYAGKLLKAVLQPDGKILMGISNTGDFTLVRYNANGTPDVSFGNRGIAIMQPGYQSALLGNFTLQPDGKIVATGFADYFVAGLGYNLTDAVVTRFTANGQPDNSFANNGKILVGGPDGADFAGAVALDFSDPAYPTGKIVIAGYTWPPGSRRLYSARLLPNGSLDNSYGTAGIVEETFTGNGYFNDVKVLADGKIIAGGCAYNSSTYTFDLLLIKYNADGSRDNSFSDDGLTVNPSGTSATAGALMEMKLLAGNKLIVVSGRSGGTAGSNFALTRYNADGSLDNSFDGDGVLPTNFISTNFDEVRTLSIDNNGKYIVAGESQTNYSKSLYAVNRYNTDGSLDNSFSGDGKLAVNLTGSIDNGHHIIRQADGKLLVGAKMVRLTDAPPVQNISEYVIARYNTDGSADNSWGTNGIKFTGITVAGDDVRLALQSDGKVLLAGTAGSSGGITVARFTTTGAADPSFDGDGKISFALIGGYTVSGTAGIGVASDGKILVACRSSYNFSDEIALLRLNTNGSLDNSYSSAGMARVGAGMPTAMLMMPDNKILLTVTNNAQGNLKRILTNGVQDPGFNGNGTVNVTAPGNVSPSLTALTTDASGNILVAGSVYVGAAGTHAILGRVTPAGEMENGFGTNGVVITDISAGTEDLFNSVQVQTNGNIIAAGTLRRSYNDQDLLVVKFSANGTRDLSLNNNTGYFTADLMTGSFDQANSFVQSGTTLYGTGNIRTDQSWDLLVFAIDVNAAVLPVRFSSFTARPVNDQSILNWRTEAEQNIDYYSVERSEDGIHYYDLLKQPVKTTGNSNSYMATDNEPFAGINYYRIRSVDLDGSSMLSEVRSVTFGKTISATIFPNPAQDRLQVTLATGTVLPAVISIYDNNGKRIASQLFKQLNQSVDIKNLAPGVYYIATGNQSSVQFIKQ